MHNCTLVVTTCKSYRDVFAEFRALFIKNWSACPYLLYVVSDENIPDSSPFVSISSAGDWISRLGNALSNIESEFVLLLLDDYFIGTGLDLQELDRAINFVRVNDAKCLRLVNIPKVGGLPTEYLDISKIVTNQPYVLNLQASIWKKSFLQEIIGTKEGSAWDFEVNLLHKYSLGCNFHDESFYFYNRDVLNIKNAVIKGAWVPDINRYLAIGHNIKFNSHRKKMSLFEWMLYSCKSFLSAAIPLNMRRPIKSLLKIFGFKFYSDS